MVTLMISPPFSAPATSERWLVVEQRVLRAFGHQLCEILPASEVQRMFPEFWQDLANPDFASITQVISGNGGVTLVQIYALFPTVRETRGEYMLQDEYWNEIVSLCEGTFPSYHNLPRQVVGRVHTATESYELTETHAAIHGVPEAPSHGQRAYVHLWPCVSHRPMQLTMETQPTPADNNRVGQIDVKWGALRLEKIGQMQGYYYPPAQTFTIFEAFFEAPFLAQELDKDANMLAFWQSLERWVRSTFPDCQRLTTPWSDPHFNVEEYRRFLRVLGYEQLPGLAAFGKRVQEDEDATR